MSIGLSALGSSALEGWPGIEQLGGMAGAAALRVALLMATARKRPDATYGSTESVFANIIET